MAIIKSTRDWEGVTVEERINTETGQIEIWTPIKPGAVGIEATAIKLASTYQDGDKNKWRIDSPGPFRTLYNNSRKDAGQAGLTEQAFNKKFYTDGARLFNNDRAATLNNNDNYSTQQEARAAREAFYDDGIPLIVNPKNGKQVNSLGVKTTEDINGEQEDGDDDDSIIIRSNGIDDEKLRSGLDERSSKRGGKEIDLRYPLESTGPFEYDYISIQAVDYKPSGLNFDFDPFKNTRGEKRFEKVILPMQPTLSETNGVNWSDDQLNPIQAMMGNFAAQTITAAGSDFKLEGIGNAFKDLGGTIKNALEDSELRSFISAYFAGQAVGANVIGRQAGMVINPNLELLFNGPNLRSFNFNFKLTPRSEPETQRCKDIIRSFKRNMAVQRSSSDLFLTSPRVFILEYIFKEDTKHPFLNKFKPCALTNFQVNYTPDNSYATFNNGSMTQYNLDMSFTEIMPIYAEDNPETETETMGF